MRHNVRIALAQINTTVGDLSGNAEKILQNFKRATDAEADMIVFPELTITGYPPEDLLMKKKFIADNLACLDEIVKQCSLTAIIGFVDKNHEIYNSAALIHEGKLVEVYHKIALPNYSVFDEKRYFTAGSHPMVFDYAGITFGVNICEDIWTQDDISECQAFLGGAEIVLNISASPYYVDKRHERLALCSKHTRKGRMIMCLVNLVGGQDELTFDGNSLVTDHRGEIIAEGKQFEEDFVLVDLDVEPLRKFRSQDAEFINDQQLHESCYELKYASIVPTEISGREGTVKPVVYTPLDRWEEVYRALMLGTRDYVRKNGFETVAIGLSGGVDSALTAAIAADALGSEHVVGVLMPSQYTSDASNVDAEALAANFGIKTHRVAIKPIFDAYLGALKQLFSDKQADTTEENLQARIRGNILMALSNKFGWLVLTTGNKSETSVGYSTLYGDTAGGFAVIKDVPKTWVYELCRHRNKKAGKELIPKAIISKAPTAELRADQTDQDSLPPYDLLDAILEEFVEKDKSVKEIIAEGYPRKIVKEVTRLVDRSEYKRRQAPPGIKITHKAFGKDRRMPITNRYKI